MERGDIFVIYGTEIFENTLKLLEAAELAELKRQQRTRER